MIFTGKVVEENKWLYPQRLFPKETGVADAALIYDPSCENGFQESPQTFLKPEIKITIPLNMARAQAEAIQNRPAGRKVIFFPKNA